MREIMSDKYALFNAIMEHKSSHCGFWHGNPHHESTEKLFKYFGVKNDFELGLKLGDTFTWVHDGWGEYKHPDGEHPFGNLYKNLDIPHLSELTDDDIDLVDKMNFPDAKYYDFSKFETAAKRAKEHKMPILSGAWASFYHTVAGLFGMENYFVKMHTDPNLVTAVSERVIDFYLGRKTKFFGQYAPDINAYFFGNDYGTQIDLMISPEMFRKFVLPHQKKLVEQAKSYNLYVVQHSCGSVVKVIPDIISCGIDGLHPIQALAAGMNAENLAEKFRDKIVFIGGVDTQVLLREGTAKQVKEDVRRLKNLFGNNFIVSPSHEAIMPDVPPENLAAVSEAVWED
jgi:uroporphyrinogen decarboxylase